MKVFCRAALAALITAAGLAESLPGAAEQLSLVRIGTGASGGTY